MDIYYPSAKLSYSAEKLSLNNNEIDLKVADPCMIFISKGELQVTLLDSDLKKIGEGDMFFLPAGISLYLQATKETTGFILHIPDVARLCHHFFQTGIVPDKNEFSQIIHPLPMKEHILRWLQSMKEYMQDHKIDAGLTEIKTFELFHLLTNSYNPETLSSFFASIIHDDYKFALFVLTHYAQVKTAEELAQLSNYSFSGFEKQFRKVFGEAPYRWMLNKKAEKVYREIAETSRPLKAIADEFGFSGLPQFNDFCRKHFRTTPGVIRNNRLKRQEL